MKNRTGQIVNDTRFADTHLAERKRRGQSGRPGGRAGPVGGLETIYLTKIQKGRQLNQTAAGLPLAKRHFSGQQKSNEAFRPLMDRFNDDPGELNVHTEMQNSGLGDGRDMSVVIAENLDKMQRQYLTTGGGAQSNYSEQPVHQEADRFRR